MSNRMEVHAQKQKGTYSCFAKLYKCMLYLHVNFIIDLIGFLFHEEIQHFETVPANSVMNVSVLLYYQIYIVLHTKIIKIIRNNSTHVNEPYHTFIFNIFNYKSISSCFKPTISTLSNNFKSFFICLEGKKEREKEGKRTNNLTST